ncbi:tRNA (adenosine(37)-N6)-dimethylallyltransferase MiaA [Candidatus Endomicrobiellum trichonymphae]|uniref:tRNA (adenosine(37)-N6)-dimethylallyltransferase MiaA n=1 Tax=Endomicrobium trichonymphae TaxID=1408204 RepID=UPI000865186A|nr:tRNA (adenosine(37)-N6)-dimethylallyltransferase MiaA [Candidatus Endomicrobium trichonymphae]BAV58964.1 tRNA delta(2)-isopentenylpyrophosphate transferase [Candidatus Endomicrobium trichonymphae]
MTLYFHYNRNDTKIIDIIVISGPTASGKTKKAVEFCKEKNGEIISCDSRQIYKYLDTGTNKEGVFLQNGLRRIDGVLQHLTDILNPDQNYSAAKFVKDADLKISEILKKGKVPVVTGGTGLYIKALLYGLDEMPKADKTLRKELKTKSQDELYSVLLKSDPEAAEKNKKNPQRLLRALEVNILSGRTMQEHFKSKSPRYNFGHYSISVDNKILYKKTNERCKYMIENGMIEETQKVLNMGFDKNCSALSGIGYRHIIQYLEKKISKEDLILEFSKDTRHYAKRQNTWFKAQPDVDFMFY